MRIFRYVLIGLSALMVIQSAAGLIDDIPTGNLFFEQTIIHNGIPGVGFLLIFLMLILNKEATKLETIVVSISTMSVLLNVALSMGWYFEKIRMTESNLWIFPLVPAVIHGLYLAYYLSRRDA